MPRQPVSLTAFRAAARLGYLIESNWTRPTVFVVFALAKPLATGLILLAMFTVVSHAPPSDPRFVALYVGNAFYIYVPLLLVGLSWAVFEDREQFQMLKYVYTAPAGLLVYLLGRALTKFVMATVSTFALLVFGIVVLHLPLHLDARGAAALLAALVVGVAGVVAVGLVIAGCSLVFARQSMTINEGAAAVLYLFCGAVFPPDILPAPLRAIALALPLTYWIESCRRTLTGVRYSALLARLGTGELLLVQLAITAVWLAGGLAAYRALERKAWRDGRLDQTTAW